MQLFITQSHPASNHYSSPNLHTVPGKVGIAVSDEGGSDGRRELHHQSCPHSLHYGWRPSFLPCLHILAINNNNNIVLMKMRRV